MVVQEESSSTIIMLEEDLRNFHAIISHLKEFIGNNHTTHLEKVIRSLKSKQGVFNDLYKFVTSNDGFGNSVRQSKI